MLCLSGILFPPLICLLKLKRINFNKFKFLFKRFLILHENCYVSEESADGIEVLIVKEMACCMNLTVKFLVFNNWGTLTDNGSWAEDGLGSAVTKEEVDLAIGFVPQNFILYKTIDFGPSLTRVKLDNFIFNEVNIIEILLFYQRFRDQTFNIQAKQLIPHLLPFFITA